MQRLKAFVILLFVAVLGFATAPAVAKHVAPPALEPVVHKGVSYVIPNDNGMKAYVEARDVQTGRKLWTRTVFRHWRIPLPFGRTECMQYEYVTAAALQGDVLLLTSERGNRYILDTATRLVRKLK